MIKIDITNKKNFISTLLLSDTFDNYLLKEAYLKTANIITIDGRENKSFYSNDDDIANLSPYEYTTWSRYRLLLYELIKGHNTPLGFKIILYAPQSITKELLAANHDEVQYLSLTVTYDSAGMSVTSAVAYQEFTLDKEADNIWDSYIHTFIE